MMVCFRPGCNQPIKPGKLACRDDWFALPGDVRRLVTESYDRRKRNIPGGVTAHRAAMASALTQWAKAR